MRETRCRHPLTERLVIMEGDIDIPDGDEVTGEICLKCHAYRIEYGYAATRTDVLRVRFNKWRYPK